MSPQTKEEDLVIRVAYPEEELLVELFVLHKLKNNRFAIKN